MGEGGRVRPSSGTRWRKVIGTVPGTPVGPIPDQRRRLSWTSDRGRPLTTALRCRDLTVTYDGHTALRAIDLDLPDAAVTAIIGPNGSGKSTLLGTLAGVLSPTRGEVTVLGGAPAEHRRRIAYVLQSTVANGAVPLTVRETVRMGVYGRRGAFGRFRGDDHEAVEAAIERLRITDLVDRQLVELSGGQRQRAFVAQGLAQRADVLLLDEPITGLDVVTQEVIAEVVREEADAGRAVVLTTHDVGTAGTADHVVLLATSLVGAGRPAQVLTPELLAQAYGGHAHLMLDGTLVIDEGHQH